MTRAPHATEHQTQAAYIEFIHLVAPKLVPIAVPNGGFRKKSEAKKLKAEGVLAGAPDVVVALPGNRNLWLETKTPIGRLSKEQRDIHQQLHDLGHLVFVVRSTEDVRDALRLSGVKTRESGQKVAQQDEQIRQMTQEHSL